MGEKALRAGDLWRIKDNRYWGVVCITEVWRTGKGANAVCVTGKMRGEFGGFAVDEFAERVEIG